MVNNKQVLEQAFEVWVDPCFVVDLRKVACRPSDVADGGQRC